MLRKFFIQHYVLHIRKLPYRDDHIESTRLRLGIPKSRDPNLGFGLG